MTKELLRIEKYIKEKILSLRSSFPNSLPKAEKKDCRLFFWLRGVIRLKLSKGYYKHHANTQQTMIKLPSDWNTVSQILV